MAKVAAKYAFLRGRIPEQQTARDEGLIKVLDAYADKNIDMVTADYNAAQTNRKIYAEKAASFKVVEDALEIMIRDFIDKTSLDGITSNGYLWSHAPDPIAVVDDPMGVVKHFQENGMEDLLQLSRSELVSRVKKFIQEEAANNELTIDTKTVVDPQTGEEKTETEVRSSIPGVKVYLKPGLSRRKAT